jgi:hypothetical protein
MAGVPFFASWYIFVFGFLSADGFERACFDTRASLLLLCLLAWPFSFSFRF